jgi:D-alanyl-lipoteichoic acid acyltransferase DltB (MBOAT superfamily)
MLFNSINFAIFLPIVFLLYWLFANRSIQAQNILLLGASYYFYASWDWRFLFLLIFSTLLDFFAGLQMERVSKISKKKFWFWLSIGINLGFLGVFKYYNFFADSFATALSNLGMKVNPGTINVVLPVGISFYTFHGLSYVIDIYRGKIRAERKFIDYAVFVSFFPLLVAGPIERATHLLPQIKSKRHFDYTKAVDGMRQILWGLFKKMVIADNCAQFANQIFSNSSDYSGAILVLGAFFFAIQIYGDFSGYSDIALGTAKLFGIELLRNFSFPYFSRNIAEFWRRWHISLSTWFRDYLYIPLGGSKGGMWMKIRNTFIIFLVSGFWHGANWTFIFWGALHAFYFLPLLISNKNRNHLDIVAKGNLFPNGHELLSMLLTFSLTTLAWIFFRAENIGHAIQYMSGLFSGLTSLTAYHDAFYFLEEEVGIALPLMLLVLLITEWIGREHTYALAHMTKIKSRAIRWIVYSSLVFCIGMYMETTESPFIYFQF